MARWRLDGWPAAEAEAVESDLRWMRPDSGAVLSPSSPEASREEAWREASRSGWGIVVEGRLRLPAAEEPDGEDILKKREGRS